MKNALKIAAFSVIPVLFYLLISSTTAFTISENTHTTKQEFPEKGKIKASDSNVFLCFSSRTKVSLASPENNVNPTVKKLSNPVFVPTKITESLFKVVFSHYTFHSKNVLYRFSQIDRLFPFHHFW